MDEEVWCAKIELPNYQQNQARVFFYDIRCLIERGQRIDKMNQNENGKLQLK